MSVSLDDVKKIRESTGASMMACKKALEDTNGDYDKLVDILRKKGEAKASEKSSRATSQGIVYSYIHTNKKVGAMVQLACETDFVAKNERFVELANDLAMQVVASNPIAIEPSDIDEKFIAKEREIWKKQLKNEGKPEEKIPMILDNKEKAARDEFALMRQAFIKDPEKNVETVVKEYITILGENIKVVRFVRYEI